jgi:protein TIF31
LCKLDVLLTHRDWNEELQTTRELPRKNLPERLLRERAIFKVHSDFVSAATRGAMAVIDGEWGGGAII